MTIKTVRAGPIEKIDVELVHGKKGQEALLLSVTSKLSSDDRKSSTIRWALGPREALQLSEALQKATSELVSRDSAH